MIALLSILVIIGVILIIIIYIQSGKVKSLGSSIVGTKDISLFENTKKRGIDRWLHIATWILVILFFLIAFAMMIVGVGPAPM